MSELGRKTINMELKRRLRVKELTDKGLSTRRIAEQLGEEGMPVNHVTVVRDQEWLSKHEITKETLDIKGTLLDESKNDLIQQCDRVKAEVERYQLDGDRKNFISGSKLLKDFTVAISVINKQIEELKMQETVALQPHYTVIIGQAKQTDTSKFEKLSPKEPLVEKKEEPVYDNEKKEQD